MERKKYLQFFFPSSGRRKEKLGTTALTFNAQKDGTAKKPGKNPSKSSPIVRGEGKGTMLFVNGWRGVRA